MTSPANIVLQLLQFPIVFEVTHRHSKVSSWSYLQLTRLYHAYKAKDY